MLLTSPISAAGLILDLAGAVALASAFAFKRPQDIRDEGASYFGMGSPSLIVGLAKQTADAWVGGTLMALGFTAQFAGSVGASDWSSLRVLLPLATGIALGAFSFLHLWLRPWNIARVVELHLIDGDPLALGGKIRLFSSALGRDDIREGESTADLAVWMLGPKRWRRITEAVDVPEEVSELS